MNKKFIKDYEMMTEKKWKFVSGIARVIKHRNLRFCLWGRLAAEKKWYSGMAKVLQRGYEKKYGLEIDFRKIEGGVLLAHPYNITVNSRAILGENITLFKGCTIGSIRSGSREGVPTIGNRVAIMMNATVCGNIKIGNDCLIAANSFVDFDVPDDSVVIGSPGVIHHKAHASKDYMTGL